MPLRLEDLRHIAARTLAHCERHPRSGWEGARGDDVSQTLARLMSDLPDRGQFRSPKLPACRHLTDGSP
jgi:hypothetical protein